MGMGGPSRFCVPVREAAERGAAVLVMLGPAHGHVSEGLRDGVGGRHPLADVLGVVAAGAGGDREVFHSRNVLVRVRKDWGSSSPLRAGII